MDPGVERRARVAIVPLGLCRAMVPTPDLVGRGG